MDNKNMEAAQRLVDAALTKLEMPEELRRVVKQIAEIVILTALQEPDEPHADAASSSHPIEELFHRHVHSEEPRATTTDTPPESALRDELTRDYWRAIENITHAVSMTTQAGASPTRAHAAVRDYLLGRLALEQSLIHTLLELPREQHVDTHAHRAAPTTRARTSRSTRHGNGHA